MVHRKSTMKATTPASEPCCPPAKEQADLRPVEGDEADEELATLAKALAHPARVKIVRILIRKNACICGDIVADLPLAQSTVSQHLKVLKEARLVTDRAEGTRRLYALDPRGIEMLRDWVDGFWDHALEAFREAAESEARQRRRKR